MSSTAQNGMPGDLITTRLLLRVISSDHVAAVVGNHRQRDWAPDYPSAGDRVIAEMLFRDAANSRAAPDPVFGQRLVVERETGLLIGGIGYFGEPENGRVEFGYGIVESRQSHGYATEAVKALIAAGLSHPEVSQVTATVEPDNPASIRVLEKNGLVFESRTETLLTYVSPEQP